MIEIIALVVAILVIPGALAYGFKRAVQPPSHEAKDPAASYLNWLAVGVGAIIAYLFGRSSG